MPRVVALVGGECTGKSTLASALSDVLPAVMVPEALRAFTEAHRRVPKREEQVEIVMAQQNAEAEIIAETALGWVVCDPATLMTAVYSRIYYDDDALTDAAIVHAELTYDAIIWCDRVRSVISQAAPTDCIVEPRFDAKLAVQIARNAG